MNLEEELICWVTLYLDLHSSEPRWYLLPRVLPGHVRGFLKSCAKFACSLIHFLLAIICLRTHELTSKQESNIIRQRNT